LEERDIEIQRGREEKREMTMKKGNGKRSICKKARS
jgi:hypothetical protein